MRAEGWHQARRRVAGVIVGLGALVLVACGGGASATPTPTPSPIATVSATPAAGPPLATPTPAAPETYVIEAGDTLSDIAERFDIDLDVLIAANGITDPTLLQIGQVLVLPPAGG